VKPIYDERVLGELSDAGARASANAEPPAAYAAYSRLVASLEDIGAAPGGVRPGDAAKRDVLDQLASGLGDLSG
jgi:hypothetical protein